MLFLKILACINKRTHQKQQQGNHRRGFLAAVFGVEMKGRIELPPVGLEPQLRYSWMQQMSASKDQTASRLYLRNYPVLPRCRCPSGPPTPSTTTCSRRFYAPNRLHSNHRPANVLAASWSNAPQAPHRSKTPTPPLPRTTQCRGVSVPMSGNNPDFFRSFCCLFDC